MPQFEASLRVINSAPINYVQELSMMLLESLRSWRAQASLMTIIICLYYTPLRVGAVLYLAFLAAVIKFNLIRFKCYRAFQSEPVNTGPGKPKIMHLLKSSMFIRSFLFFRSTGSQGVHVIKHFFLCR